MQQEFIHYRVTQNTPTHQKVLQAHNAIMAVHNQRKAVATKYGADAVWANSSKIVGLIFQMQPESEGFKLVKSPNIYGPNKSTKAGRALAKEFNLPYPINALHKAICPEAGFGFFDALSTGQPCLRSIGYEDIGEVFILNVPVCTDAKNNWTPPVSDCVRLKNSEYWALKEAEEKAAKTEAP